MQESDLQRRLRQAIEAGYVSPPQCVELPRDFPFHVATCAVDLPEGCLPPGDALSRRLGVGRGRSREEAACLALLEGVERYSLQYRRDMPAALPPVATVGGDAEPAAREALVLGAPDGALQVTSRGAAAGADFEGAARRAVLELLEQHHAGGPAPPGDRFQRVDAATVGPLAGLAAWLAERYRTLDLRVAQVADGCFVALAASGDLDGGRRTEGSAAGPGLFDTLVHAAEEAVFHWRNMVALDYVGTGIAALSPGDRAELARYRGAAGRAAWPEAALCRQIAGDIVLTAVTGDLMAALARASGRRVRLFDMTQAVIAVPVAKALVG